MVRVEVPVQPEIPGQGVQPVSLTRV
jgi:hypothetical protein